MVGTAPCGILIASEIATTWLIGDNSRLLKVKGKGRMLDIALLHDEHMLMSALQSRKWQLSGMS